MRSAHYTKHRVSSAQIMATMRSWPNVSAASVGRGQPVGNARSEPKEGEGEMFARDLRLAMAAAASRNVVVTYRKRRRVVMA